jgi:hypothetical protein
MHDIDRALFETEAGYAGEEEWSGEEEYTGEGELFEYSTGEGETTGYEFGDRESELATELLEITSEQELDRFLGSLISTAVSGVRNFARSKAGQAVGGILKNAAKKALPQLGQALGDTVGAGSLGKQAGSWLGGKLELGLQTEGLSAEDREYEAARAFVRFAGDTAQRAAQAGGNPATAAQQAATAAARRHLPGLLQGGGSGGTRSQSGRWVRRGNHIVLLGT